MKQPRYIATGLGRFYKALITEHHIYYVNYQEGDENGNTIMYDREMKLVSDNYFANVGLMEDLLAGKWEYIGPNLKKNLKLILENLQE